MFKSKKITLNPSATDTLIGEGTMFEGRIVSEASIRIEGHLNGDIECTGDVTIGENGVVRSNIQARDVTIAGHVTGNVITTGKLTIMATGRMSGNTTSAAFIIEEGGVFQGTSIMDKPSAASEPGLAGSPSAGNSGEGGTGASEPSIGAPDMGGAAFGTPSPSLSPAD